MSSVTLEMHPETPPLTWMDFVYSAAPFSIALDGYVRGGPAFRPRHEAEKACPGPYLNLNHHEDVDRLATRATCAQVLMAIRQGLFHAFRDEHGARATVYVNDCDEDVCLSWFLLKHHHLVESAMNPAINRLVHLEDMMDATAGAYPLPADLPILSEMAWVFEPYRACRLSGELDKRDARAYLRVVEDVENRIMKHVTGHGSSIPIDTRYERVGGGTGWTMIKEIGAQARTGAFADGVRAYVSMRESAPKTWVYVIGRMSPFIPFDVTKLISALNSAEYGEDWLEMLKPPPLWGGSDIVGGSPRSTGSRLSPEDVTKVINEQMEKTP